MTNYQSLGALFARILLSFMFILAGWGKLFGISAAMAYTASSGLPGVAIFPGIAIELLGGLAVLVGWQTRWAALTLAAFCVLTAVLFHYIPGTNAEGMARVGQMINFQKNLTIAGGMLLLAVMGPGRLSVDAQMAK